MAERITTDELAFLRSVERLAEDGLPLIEIAARHGVAPGTITYRLARLGLRVEPFARVRDQRTGKSIAELIEDGTFVVAAEPVEAAT